ncbi:unnamed protein product [Psylliodes chrysocephalus]|uniref:Uncharacterized protein n=1 Tax=Psylliodes chrysocephalus TaxID=3402493 RepID=A0A9P0D795_9CUCU|nr:unnamed protein product [Psylliodes chrysocephala]
MQIKIMEKLKEDIIEELKNAISASECRILQKIDLVNEKIKELEEENKTLKETVEHVHQTVKKKFYLFLDVKESDISDLYLIGRGPLKIELTTKFTKVNILRNCKKLKGTNITITSDLIKAQQERNKILAKRLKEIRKQTKDRCYIKGEKLYINIKAYTVEDISLEEKLEEEKRLSQKQKVINTPSPPIPEEVFESDCTKEAAHERK